MRRSIGKIGMCVLLAAVLLVAVAATACGEKQEEKPTLTVESITLDTSGVQTVFDYGEQFTFDGLKVKAKMSDGTTRDVPLGDCDVTNLSTTLPGKRTVTVKYGGKSASYTVTVNEMPQPVISDELLASVTGPGTYVVEAEDIDLESTLCVHSKGGGEFVEVPLAEAAIPITSGGKSIGCIGVVDNLIGFKFESDADYNNVTFEFRVAYGAESIAMLDDACDIRLNDERILTGGYVTLEHPEYMYWDWKDIPTSDPCSIVKGVNVLSMEVTNGNAPNIDCIRIIVNENTEPEPEPSDSLITEGGVKKTIEAETLGFDASAGAPVGIAELMTSGLMSVNGLQSGDTAEYEFASDAEAVVKADFSFAYGGEGSAALDEYVKIEFNGSVLTTGATLSRSEKYGEWNWTEATAENIPVVAGKNTVKFTVLDVPSGENMLNFDKFDLTVTSYGGQEAELPAVMKEDCDMAVTGGGAYRTEAEYADWSDAILRADYIAANKGMLEVPITAEALEATSGGKCVSGAAGGSVIRVRIWADKAYENAELTVSLCVGDTLDPARKVDEYLSFSMNETPFVAGDDALLTGNRGGADFWHWEPFTVTVALTEGANVLTVRVADSVNCPTLDYFEVTVG